MELFWIYSLLEQNLAPNIVGLRVASVSLIYVLIYLWQGLLGIRHFPNTQSDACILRADK